MTALLKNNRDLRDARRPKSTHMGDFASKMQKIPILKDEKNGAAATVDAGDDVADESEPAVTSTAGATSDPTGSRVVADRGVPMIIGAYEQPEVVGFDAQFKPAGLNNQCWNRCTQPALAFDQTAMSEPILECRHTPHP